MTEGIGAVAEAQTQAAMAGVARGQPAWTTSDPVAAPQSGVLAVEVNGVYVHRDDGWPEMKVVTVAPLGPIIIAQHRGRIMSSWSWRHERRHAVGQHGHDLGSHLVRRLPAQPPTPLAAHAEDGPTDHRRHDFHADVWGQGGGGHAL
jgi:hypothetical protein